MGPAVGYGDFGRSFTRPASPPHAFAVFLSSPDDWSFQHWSDRVAIMLAQADHLLEASGLNATLIVAAPRGAPQLPELWRLAAPRATIVPPRAGMTSERLLYPCHTPLLHPFTRRRIVERILIAAGMDPAGAPLASRKTVAFLTRGDGTSTASRAWLNQEANLAATRALLAERGQREVVEIFSVRTLATDQLAALKFFARARAIVGVHGGAMCNHLWAAPDTLVLEIWPVTADGSKTRSGNVFWCVVRRDLKCSQILINYRLPYHDLIAFAPRHCLRTHHSFAGSTRRCWGRSSGCCPPSARHRVGTFPWNRPTWSPFCGSALGGSLIYSARY
jgi:hypothetical protein